MLRAYPYRIRKERLQRQWRIYQLSRFNKVRRLEEQLQRTTNPPGARHHPDEHRYGDHGVRAYVPAGGVVSECSLKAKVKMTEDWLAEHAGHDVVEEVEDYSLVGGAAIKRMSYRRCNDCDARHLYNMETIENVKARGSHLMMRFEVWVSEKLSRAINAPVGEDTKDLLDNLTGGFPNFARDWVLDHNFEAPDEEGARLYMVEWVEAQAPNREITFAC